MGGLSWGTDGEPPAGLLLVSARPARVLNASGQWSITALKAGGSAEVVIGEIVNKLKNMVTPGVISAAEPSNRGAKEEGSGRKFKIKYVLKYPLMDTHLS